MNLFCVFSIATKQDGRFSHHNDISQPVFNVISRLHEHLARSDLINTVELA